MAEYTPTIEKAEETPKIAVLRLTSYKIRIDQKAMIEAMAKSEGESQATILRRIIDEWRLFKGIG